MSIIKLHRKQYLLFEEAKIVVSKLGIKNSIEWMIANKQKDFPNNIPKYPHNFYSEWVDWYDWFGKKSKEYLPFEEARVFARSLKLKTQMEWFKCCNIGKIPDNIPLHPHSYYSRRKCWTGWNDFLNINTFHKKYYVNDDYFKKWSHNMAYILGFWFADGYMLYHHGSYLFYIKQHQKDQCLLEEIIKEMKSNCFPHITKSGGNCCTMSIYSKEIYNDIKKLGGKENKSLDCKFPYVPKKYLPDFIRGYFDGDGCIVVNKYSSLSIFTSGSKDFIYKLHDILKENIPDITGHIYKHITKKGALNKYRIINKDEVYCSLHLSTNDTRRLRNFMYSTPSNLKLMRKWYKMQKTGEIKYSKNKSNIVIKSQ